MQRESTGLEIAVIGMAGRFPGAASLDAYWQTILQARNSITRTASQQTPRHRDFVSAWGVLDEVDRFDASYFGYNPRDAALLDPQQRALLQTAVHTLEHAGYAGAGEPVGVYAGASISTYLLQNLLGNPAASNAGYAELILGNDKDTLATRISYHLDLRGPSMSVQSACSTSLVAVHLACQALLTRDCDLALAGGVSIQLPQDGYLAEAGGILSPVGHCRPFDADADGVVPGSGVAMVALKCLDDALRDGDTIHAVIIGSAVTNDGASKIGFTAPSIDSQADTVRTAQRLAEVDPDAIAYVEAHGTGTSMGDPIEVAALTRAFRAGTARRGYCALGSVKSLIGHLDAAAGVAGLIKTVLALQHGVLPPSPHVRQVNPVLDLPTSPFYLPATATAWPAGQRFAAVNSIGMGGTNAHVVVQQAPPAASAGTASRTWHVLPVSAMTPARLAASRQSLAAHLGSHASTPLADVAHTLQVGRRVLPHRLAAVCADTGVAAELLATGGSGVRAARQESRDTPVVFMFPGQGSQRLGMAREVYRDEPVFRQHLDRIGGLLTGHGIDLLDLLYGTTPAGAQRLSATANTQPALFAVEYSLARLWMSWGIRPVAMIGHSVGEFVAACLAGTFTLEDAVALVAARGALMGGLPPGAMLAVGVGVEAIEHELGDEVVLAADNSPSTCVVSGSSAAVLELAGRLRQRGVPHRELVVSHAFHSPMMASITDEFTGLVERLRPRPPELAFVSNVTGRWITAEQATDPAYWAQQAVLPVRFREGVALLLKEDDRILLEVGPGHTLCKLVREQRPAAGHTVVPSLGEVSAPAGDDRALASALAGVWLAGGAVDWAGYWPERRRRIPLPGYPFDPQRHWIDAPLPTAPPNPNPPPETVHPDPVDAIAQDHDACDDEPADEITQRVRLVWQEMLGHPRIGLHDDFFEHGGHSLLAIRMTTRLGEVFGIALPIDCLFNARTIAQLAGVIADRLGTSAT